MQDSNIPVKFPIPFANSAGGGFIRSVPQASQIGVQNGAASLTDGFPPNCFIPIAAGGSWPFGQDANGILKQITQWLQWGQAGGPVFFDSAFSTAIGGYPKGAVLTSSVTTGIFWISTVDNNTSNPDTGGANWITIQSRANTWTVQQTFNTDSFWANNAFIYGKDTGGTDRQMLGYGTDNNPTTRVGTGGLWKVLNAAGSATVFKIDNSGNVTSGAVDATGNVAATIDVNAARDVNATRNVTAALLRAVAGATAHDPNAAPIMADFASSLSGTGWKKYPDPNSPSGYIIEQWGFSTVPANTTTNVTLPIAFPNGTLASVATFGNVLVGGNTYSVGCSTSSLAVITIAVISNVAGSLGVNWRATGY